MTATIFLGQWIGFVKKFKKNKYRDTASLKRQQIMCWRAVNTKSCENPSTRTWIVVNNSTYSKPNRTPVTLSQPTCVVVYSAVHSQKYNNVSLLLCNPDPRRQVTRKSTNYSPLKVTPGIVFILFRSRICNVFSVGVLFRIPYTTV